MTTLTRLANDEHRVACDRCGYVAQHPDVRDAVNDYVDHKCEASA